jgi:hypothetical protein
VVARRLLSATFQPVQRRLAGHRRTVLATAFQLARQHRHHRIVPQLVVIVEVFITQRNPEHALPNQGRHRVFDQIGAATIAKAVCKPIHQINGSIGRAQKQRSRIRCHQSGIERRFHRAPLNHSKIKLFCATLRLHRGFLESLRKSLRHNNFR